MQVALTIVQVVWFVVFRTSVAVNIQYAFTVCGFGFLDVLDPCLKTPLTGKVRVCAPVLSSRKALGVVNKIVATSAASVKAEDKAKPAEAKVDSCFIS